MKRVKFPLNMGKGIQVRTLAELQENFNFEKITKYFLNGKLAIWLEDRGLMDLKEQLSEISISDEMYSNKICELFAIPYMDIYSHSWKRIQKGMEWLRENTDNKELLCRAYDLIYCDKKRAVCLDWDNRAVELYRLEDMERWTLLENVCSKAYFPFDTQSMCFLTEYAGKIKPVAVNFVYKDNRELVLSTGRDIIAPIYNEKFVKDLEKIYITYQVDDRPDASYLWGYLVERERRPR